MLQKCCSIHILEKITFKNPIMKKLLTSLLIVLQIQAFTAEKPKSVKSEIKEVSVFLSGAQVTRAGNTNINAGTSELIFENLPSNINEQSIQVTGKGDFTILSVNYQLNYLKEAKLVKNIQSLKDSLDFLNDQLIYEKDMQVVYQEEEAMIKSNKAIGGQNVGVKIIDLKEGADYFRTRLTDIKTKWQAHQKKIVKLNKEITLIKNQLNVLNSRENKPSGEIIVTVTSKTPTLAALTLSYFVQDAGWVPLYDLRAKDSNSPVDLAYKANIWQLTGEDWEKVSLSLNTGNPTLSGSKPNLAAWYLYIYYPQKKRGKRNETAGFASQSIVMAKEESKKSDKAQLEEDMVSDALTSANYTTVAEGQTSVEFKIEVPYNVPSDGKHHMVEVQKYTIPATYEYYCAPKLDKDAFLIAHVTGWESYNLLSGEMNLFFEGTYVGKSYLDVASTNDTLDISLGRDKNIVVSRTKLKDFSKKSFVGSTKKETRGFEIEVRNKKKQQVQISIHDQFPLSTNKEIEVEHIEMSGAKFDESTGFLSWQFDLAPTETKKFKMQYAVKYPKTQTIILE
ncbi:MAG: hypothetical protein A2275_10465 [Bacteroidetes bacterium RIFOXYA12_FULL_35_11]|nr:MAG: hypothetical protein A2X01_12875 [Bacteroidetes bacterium GWF2_35_48]OFY74491.1 MAG: hypothetical protein A2275_10465 [Bacteroidetes bacterium RIFOXYA12_FULL_35_11]HBX50294.1 hypothetical protein [Bacteroidales bacterium]